MAGVSAILVFFAVVGVESAEALEWPESQSVLQLLKKVNINCIESFCWNGENSCFFVHWNNK